VRGRADFHCFLRDVDISELFELMIHARQLALDVFLCVRNPLFDPGNIEINPAMRSSAPFLDLAHDAPRHVISRE
jgi:hypothetical protein